jgi:spoIIIJ-associated protein
MSAQNEYTGTDIDEAINKACSSLDVSREQLSIQVISPGSAGILGLFRKKAVIQASLKDRQSNSMPPKNKAKRDNYRKKNQSSPKPNRPQESTTPPKDASPEVLAEIKTATQTVLDLMGYPAEATLTSNNGKVQVNILGDHLETIIGPEGNTLDAMQYLVRKIVSQKFSEKIMLSMDAGDFRATRKRELEELALEIARIVKDGGKSRIIAPLNPAERRTIHVALQNDKTIRSKSIGEGLFKKIKVYIPGQGRKRSSKKRNYGKPRHVKKASQAKKPE